MQRAQHFTKRVVGSSRLCPSVATNRTFFTTASPRRFTVSDDAFAVPIPPTDYQPKSKEKVINRTTTDLVPTSSPSNVLYHAWKMVKFDMDGKVKVVDVPRADLYSKFGLQGRDIRIIVSNMNYPTILARKHCIVLDIKNVSCIITENALYLLKNDAFDPAIIPFIQQEIKYHRTASKIMQKDLFKSGGGGGTAPPSNGATNGDDTHPNDYHTQQYGYFEHSHALPFEFQMLECILHKVCREVVMEYDILQSQVRKTLHDPNLANSEELLFDILQHKQHMNKFTTFVRELHETVDALLQSDEDMAQIYLTETFIFNRPRAIDDHEEIEMLLETYLTQLEDVINRIDELRNDMNSTQEFLEVCLDAMRNRIIEYELKMTIAGFALTFGTLVAGLFGMNLINHWEHSPTAFYLTCAGIGVASFTIFMGLMLKMRRKGVFVSTLRRVGNPTRRYESPIVNHTSHAHVPPSSI